LKSFTFYEILGIFNVGNIPAALSETQTQNAKCARCQNFPSLGSDLLSCMSQEINIFARLAAIYARNFQNYTGA
jgi:hypothetical protein